MHRLALGAQPRGTSEAVWGGGGGIVFDAKLRHHYGVIKLGIGQEQTQDPPPIHPPPKIITLLQPSEQAGSHTSHKLLFSVLRCRDGRKKEFNRSARYWLKYIVLGSHKAEIYYVIYCGHFKKFTMH